MMQHDCLVDECFVDHDASKFNHCPECGQKLFSSKNDVRLLKLVIESQKPKSSIGTLAQIIMLSTCEWMMGKITTEQLMAFIGEADRRE